MLHSDIHGSGRERIRKAAIVDRVMGTGTARKWQILGEPLAHEVRIRGRRSDDAQAEWCPPEAKQWKPAAVNRYSELRKAIRARRSSALISLTASLAFSASPPWNMTASIRVAARPSWR